MRRILGPFAIAIALATVTLAIAQPRAPGRGPQLGPPHVAVDAGAGDNSYGPSSAASAPSAAPSTSTLPASAPALYDGGVRLSPLNPEANEFGDGGAPPQSVDYDKLLGDIAALRARVAAVSDNLFHSRLAVTMETSGDHGRIARLTVSLDDGIVYTAPPNFVSSDALAVYDHAVAPGRHALTVEVERRDDRGDSFRSTQRSRFTVDVPAEQRLALDVKIWDDSSMGGDFASDKSGKYDLRIRATAEAKPVAK